MTGVRIGVGVVWVVFWIYWFGAATRAKRSINRAHWWRGRVILAILVVVLVRVLHPSGTEIRSVPLACLGLLIMLTGFALAVWARVQLGRNWGMPATVKEEPELVTSGPYRLVRHPIYTGLILAVAGTALSVNLVDLVVAAVAGVLFIYSARIEERNLATAFPAQYPPYRQRTKMLIPWLL